MRVESVLLSKQLMLSHKIIAHTDSNIIRFDAACNGGLSALKILKYTTVYWRLYQEHWKMTIIDVVI
jgi:hypothetical protein